MLKYLFPEQTELISVFGLMLMFVITFISLIVFSRFLPRDLGRDFAFNGKKSQGKPRGAGIIFVTVFFLMSLLFSRFVWEGVGFSWETLIYLILILLGMVTGYLDDRSDSPWSEYLKGFLDFVIALGVAMTYLLNNPNSIYIVALGQDITINRYLFAALIIILVWVSINVTNCTDGVDGLSGALSIITLSTIFLIGTVNDAHDPTSYLSLLYAVGLLAYLWFNASPSTMMMGDAGSRATGVIIAIAILKSGSPLLYIPVALVIILDGGLGLVKLFLGRFFKIKILKNIRTPLHDHFRKNRGWSDTQTVFRFMIVQIGLCAVALCFLIWRRGDSTLDFNDTADHLVQNAFSMLAARIPLILG